MRVLLTGGAGFIGHHLAAALLDAGHEVVVFDNLRRGNFRRLDRVRVHCIEGDVRDAAALSSAAYNCAAIIHLAAQANVMGSEEDPAYAFESNVNGTWNVARVALEHGCRVAFASSREVYGNPESVPVSEDAPRRPHNVYGLTKKLGEDILANRVFNAAPITILRLANVIGPGDSGRVVPIWIAAAQQGQPLPLHGGRQVLDFVPVDVVCAAFLRSLERESSGTPINVGSGRGTTLIELTCRIANVLNSPVEVLRLPARDAEVSCFVAETTRLRSLLGIEPPSDPLAGLDLSWGAG
jgi:UDP-glucose 4-epimerase